MARPKGAKNKATIQWLRRVANGKKSPVEFLLEVMDGTNEILDAWKDEDGNVIEGNEEKIALIRMDAARQAAPYCHPKLQNISVSQLLEDLGGDGQTDTGAVPRATELVEDLYRRAAGANITPISKD